MEELSLEVINVLMYFTYEPRLNSKPKRDHYGRPLPKKKNNKKIKGHRWNTKQVRYINETEKSWLLEILPQNRQHWFSKKHCKLQDGRIIYPTWYITPN